MLLFLVTSTVDFISSGAWGLDLRGISGIVFKFFFFFLGITYSASNSDNLSLLNKGKHWWWDFHRNIGHTLYKMIIKIFRGGDINQLAVKIW